MNERKLRTMLQKFRQGKLAMDTFLREIRHLPFQDLEYAKVDHHRALRCGFPEIIFCQGKTPAQVGRIARELLKHGSTLLATRCDRKTFAQIKKADRRARYHEIARCAVVRNGDMPRKKGLVLIITAGTSDIPVAEEARVTAETLGNPVRMLVDVGVAGIHRLLSHQRLLGEARVLIVVAGMEGALASVVGGLVRRPVLAVPTSVGYGASFKGIAPLLTMMNSCAAGVSVVNIDNGFGAGYMASLINQ